jgi:hypothetical protein
VRVLRQRDEAERRAKATVSARPAKPARQKATHPTHGAENGEFVSLPESWLDMIRLGFPRANSW